jgi:hypothetical protein
MLRLFRFLRQVSWFVCIQLLLVNEPFFSVKMATAVYSQTLGQHQPESTVTYYVEYPSTYSDNDTLVQH